MLDKNDHGQALVELICLCYHEARNVRHPLRQGKVAPDAKYAALLNLAHNRDDAWQQMGMLRAKAPCAQTPRGAAHVFQKSYGLSLEDLSELFGAPCWKDSACGGNKWSAICSRVCDLLQSLERRDESCTAQLVDTILGMRHNTGKVGEKLLALNSD